jgi:hypothetical protein
MQHAVSLCTVSVLVTDAGQGEFSAVGFSYGASADGPVQSRAGGPIEDLGEEASSESSGMQQGSLDGGSLIATHSTCCRRHA